MSLSSAPAVELLSSFHKNRIAPRIALINIMDNAAGTERHFVKTIKKANPDSEIFFCRMACAKLDKKYFDEQNYLLSNHYVDWHDVIGREDIDLVIVTGINRGKLSYDDLVRDYPDFWNESKDMFKAIHTSLSTGKTGHAALVCWSAFAGMKELFGIDKAIHDKKFYGLFNHKIELPDHPLVRNFGNTNIAIPQSRHSYMDEVQLRDVIAEHNGQVIMSHNNDPAIWTLADNRISCFINHLEYSIDTLSKEYQRDSLKESGIDTPQNYDPNNYNSAENIMAFNRLSTSCSAFYKNLIELAQSQKPSKVARSLGLHPFSVTYEA